MLGTSIIRYANLSKSFFGHLMMETQKSSLHSLLLMIQLSWKIFFSLQLSELQSIQQADDRALEFEHLLAQPPPPDDDRVTENTHRPEPATNGIGNVINTPISLSDLDKYNYYTKHFIPKKQEGLFQRKVVKTKGRYILNYQLKWLHERKWHVYSEILQGGLCKACMLFGDSKVNRGNFVTNAFHDVSKSNKIVEHENHDYHQTALENAKSFIENVENPTTSNFNRGSNKTYKKNLHILKRIIPFYCVQSRGLALHGHYDHYQPDDEPCEVTLL